MQAYNLSVRKLRTKDRKKRFKIILNGDINNNNNNNNNDNNNNNNNNNNTILFINHITTSLIRINSIKATNTGRITSKLLTSKSNFFFSSVVTDVKPKNTVL